MNSKQTMKYEDFEVQISPSEGQYKLELLYSLEGELSEPIISSLPLDELQYELDELRFPSTDKDQLTALGERLYRFLFAPPIAEQWRVSLAKARERGKGLNLRLRLHDPALAELPWELLYNPDEGHFLIISWETPLLRYLVQPTAIPSLKVRPPLRVLLALAPVPPDSGYKVLDIEREKKWISKALAPLIKAKRIELAIETMVTRQNLPEHLRRDYHLFHYIGHGKIDNRGVGQLVLPDGAGGVKPLSGEELFYLIRDTSLKLVFLNGCQTARESANAIGRGEPFVGVAQSLIKAGLPAVVAMQFNIPDTSAAELAKAFYSSLADGYSIQAAVGEGRKAVMLKAGLDQKDWAAPALFMRAREGQLFDKEASDPLDTTPSLPNPYYVHEYSLLQPSELVGRKNELSKLNLWIDGLNKSAIRVVSAIGGMGKSALTWKWFKDVINANNSGFNGYLWWSFYESDADFDNFLIHTLSYVSQISKRELEKLKRYELQERLLEVLMTERFLLILDGFERQLNAYHNIKRYIPEVEVDEFAKIFSQRDEHYLRKTTDLKVGEFIRKLSRSQHSKILITSRLFPANLETPIGEHLNGCDELQLHGLSDEDALELWRSIRLQGSPIKMFGSDTRILGILNAFDNYPLLIRILAGEVAKFRRSPGDFEAWLTANPDFSIANLPLIQIQSHVLTYALKGLDPSRRTLLRTLSAFFIPAMFDTLLALLVGDNKEFATENDLDEALTELEDRGLVGWDRRTYRYSLHPVVRGVVWDTLNEHTQKDIQRSITNHFLAIPIPRNARTLEQLTPVIQIYLSLIEQGRYEEAFNIFFGVLNSSSLFFRSTVDRVNLLKKLFGNGLNSAPNIDRTDQQTVIFNAMGQGYTYSGQPKLGVSMYYRALRISENKNARSIWINLTEALCPMGELYDCFVASCNALKENRKHRDDDLKQAISLTLVGLSLAVCEPNRDSEPKTPESKISSLKILTHAIYILQRLENSSSVERVTFAYLAQRAVWMQDKNYAEQIAEIAWKLANVYKYDRDLTRTAKLQGLVALMFDKIDFAEERLYYSLKLSREINCVEDELPALVGLAEIARRRSDFKVTETILDDVFELAQGGPYLLALVDAYNVLAHCKQDQGNNELAVELALKAYRKAWCDGISKDNQNHFAYTRGIEDAKKILDNFNIEYPKLPEFSFQGRKSMPQIELKIGNNELLNRLTLVEVGNDFIRKYKKYS